MRGKQTDEFGFRPITLQTYDCNRNLSQERGENKVHEYHKLLKMKKILADTEQKMHNRIKLFKKASEKIIKKREVEIKTFSKIENVKNHPFFLEKIRSRDQVKTAEGRRRREERMEKDETEDTRILAERLLHDRMQNARTLKEEKQRFKVIIEQRKKIDLQRKLQSANSIRRKRQNAKIMKQQMQNDRREDFMKQINQKYQREREQFVELQRHLNQLQFEQQQALLQWKKTMDCIKS